MDYLSLTDLLPPLQLGFQQGHSTETAVLLRVLSDILQAVDRGDLAAPVLLDLSAADHSILLECLQQTFGIGDTALHWFQSYLSSRKQYVYRDSSLCRSSTWSAACRKDPSWARSCSPCIQSIS